MPKFFGHAMSPSDFIVVVALAASAVAFGLGLYVIGPSQADFQNAQKAFVASAAFLIGAAAIWSLTSDAALLVRVLVLAATGAISIWGCDVCIAIAQNHIVPAKTVPFPGPTSPSDVLGYFNKEIMSKPGVRRHLKMSIGPDNESSDAQIAIVWNDDNASEYYAIYVPRTKYLLVACKFFAEGYQRQFDALRNQIHETDRMAGDRSSTDSRTNKFTGENISLLRR